MNRLAASPSIQSKHHQNPSDTTHLEACDLPLHVHIQRAIENYLSSLEDEKPTQMYDIFLHQLEKPLLETVLRHTRGNQSKTAQMLGLNRGTLRTKLKTHNLL